MKKYFGKCVIERPRHGSSGRNIKIRDFGKFVQTEDGIEYEGISRVPTSSKAALITERDRKDFSDLLGPIHKFLRSRCGRLWDDVYSEIAYGLGRFTKSEGVRHIKDAHISVATNCWYGEDGKVYTLSGYSRNGPDEVHIWYAFYVDPATGILRSARNYGLWNGYRSGKKQRPIEVIPVSDLEEYRKIDGLWYYQRYILTEPAGHKEDFRVESGSLAGIKGHHCTYCNGKPEKKLAEKRQAGKKELKWIKVRIAKTLNAAAGATKS